MQNVKARLHDPQGILLELYLNVFRNGLRSLAKLFLSYNKAKNIKQSF